MNPKNCGPPERPQCYKLRWRWNANPGWPCPMPNHQLVHCKKRPEADTGPFSSSSSSSSFFSSSSCYVFFTDLCSYSAALLCKGNHKGRMTHSWSERHSCGRYCHLCSDPASTFFSLSDPSFGAENSIPSFSSDKPGWARGGGEEGSNTKDGQKFFFGHWSSWWRLSGEFFEWVSEWVSFWVVIVWWLFFQKENPPDENPQKMK